jgi:branched-chain amino acid transport system substrate-binding protein
MPAFVVAVLVCLALAAPASADDLVIYSSLPLGGSPAQAYNEDVLRGEQLALEAAGGVAGPHTVRLVSLEAGGRRGWTPGRVAANARRAAQDAATIAYLGEANSGATAISLPILNEAGIPQVSPTSTYVGLTRGEGGEPGEPAKYYPTGLRTFARVAPGDHLQAAAIAQLLRELRVRRVFVVDDAEVFGASMRRLLRPRLRARGVRVVGTASLQRGNARRIARQVRRSRARAMVYTGITANGAVGLWRRVHRRAPRAALVGSEGVADAGFAGRIAAGAARRTYVTVSTLAPAAYPPAAQNVFAAYRARFGREANASVLYGYEAMSLALDAIARAGAARDLRAAAFDALLATRGRDSVLGRYSIDRRGDTTLSTYGIYRVSGGALTFERAIDSSG